MNCTKEARESRKWAVGSRKRSKVFFISAVFLLFVFSSNAQISGKSILELRQEDDYQSSIIPRFHYSILPLSQFSNFKSTLFYSKPRVPIIYSYNDLAFFCKVEVKLEKAVKLPIKFRLGDVEYVDRLEGKRE